MTFALVFVWFLSLFDALATTWWVARGVEEWNPLMAIWLPYGAGVFILAKTSLTTAGLTTLAWYHRKNPHRLLEMAARFLVLVYIGIALWHVTGFYMWSRQ